MTHPIVLSEAGVEYLKLPVPQTEGGMPLLTAMQQRRSTRRGLLDRRALATAMRLEPDQRVILAQSVGYPT